MVTAEPFPPGGPKADGCVFSDHRVAMRMLLDHLGERGARHPALLAPDENSAWAHSLVRSYLDWCEERRIRPVLREIEFDPETTDVKQVTTALMEADVTPDGIVVAPDGAVSGVLACATDLGLKVGEDILVATCVDSAYARMSSPPITALALHPREFGRRCVELLVQLLVGEREPGATDEQPIELLVRESTAPGHDR